MGYTRIGHNRTVHWVDDGIGIGYECKISNKYHPDFTMYFIHHVWNGMMEPQDKFNISNIPTYQRTITYQTEDLRFHNMAIKDWCNKDDSHWHGINKKLLKIKNETHAHDICYETKECIDHSMAYYWTRLCIYISQYEKMENEEKNKESGDLLSKVNMDICMDHGINGKLARKRKRRVTDTPDYLNHGMQ